MKIINLSGRDVNLYSGAGELLHKCPFDKVNNQTIFVDTERNSSSLQKTKSPIDGVNCVQIVFGKGESFPDAKEGVILLVSDRAIQSMKNRKDVFVVNQGLPVARLGLDDKDGFFGLIGN